MESLSDTESTLPTQGRSVKGKSSSKIVVGILVFVILLLLGILGFLYLQGAFEEITDNEVVVEQEEGVEKVEETKIAEELDAEQEEEVKIVNAGWGLFSLPEYGFSVEIPDYIDYQDFPINTYEGPDTERDVPFHWAVKHGDKADLEQNIFSDLHSSLVHNIKVLFYPDKVPYDIGCTSCIEEQNIDVYIYRENTTFEKIKELYSEKVSRMLSSEDCSGEYSVEKKWDRDVVAYDLVCIGGAFKGYVFPSDEYVFLVLSRLIPNPEATSYKMALKIMDSMRFE